MKRTWLLAAAIAGATAVGSGAATLALFTAQSDPAAANLTAGTLELAGDRDQGDTVPGPMFYTTEAEGMVGGAVDAIFPTGYWAPGDSHTRVFQIENIGTLDAKLMSLGATLQSPDNAMPDILDVTVYSDATESEVLYSGKLRALLGAPADMTAPVELASGDMASLHYEVTMPVSAGNDYQGLPLVVTFYVNAEQLANNP